MIITQNTLILVYYMNVSAFSNNEDKLRYLEEIKDAVKNEGCFSLVLPVEEQDTRVECINPKYMSEGEYKKIEQNIEEAEKRLKKFLQSFDNNTKY